MGAKTRPTKPAAIRRLSQNEIDRRIEGVAAEVAARMEDTDDRDFDLSGAAAPRWISPGELVRHMRPFVVLN